MGKRSSNIDQRLPKNEIIKKEIEFKKILTRGKVWKGTHITCYTLKGPERRVGFLVGRKTGNAVVRNRVKRYMRETYRKNRHNIDNIYLLMYAKMKSHQTGYQDIYNDFQNFLKNEKYI